MSGFTTSSLSLIAQNLHERYANGYPILKELIQNSDDAKANNIWIGLHEGFSQSPFQLLKSKGLWLLNDGGFTAANKRAIASIGESSKAGDADTIGKFGLGMKSVFHLCEACYYLANSEAGSFSDLLNPYAGFQGNKGYSCHQEWEDSDQEALSFLEKRVNEITGLKVLPSRWFFLWIPLRTEEHLHCEHYGRVLPIVSTFPLADGLSNFFLCQPDIAKQISSLLILLKNVQRIQVSGLQDPYNFECYVQEEQAVRMSHGKENIQGEFDCTFVNQAGTFVTRNQFVQRFSFDPFFEKLRTHPKWPSTRSYNPVTSTGNGLEVHLDKTFSESAIAFALTPFTEHLELNWALFLPVEEASHQFVAAANKLSKGISIYLHGQFFVDSGRKGIRHYDSLGARRTDDKLNFEGIDPTACWNQTLVQEHLLEFFLEGLANFLVASKLSQEEITKVVGSIQALRSRSGQVNFYERFGHFLTKSNAYYYCLCQDFQQWQLISTQTFRPLQIPSPPSSDPSRPWDVFPKLSNLANVVLVDLSQGYLDHRNCNWTAADIDQVLGDPAIEEVQRIFRSEKLLNYFVQLIKQVHHTLPVGIERVLERWLRLAFSKLTFSELAKHQSKVRELLELCVHLPIAGVGGRQEREIDEATYRVMAGLPTRTLLVPRRFLEGTRKPSGIPTEDFAFWLHSASASASVLNGKDRAIGVSNLILDLLELLGTRVEDFLIENSSLFVIPLQKSGSTENPHFLSYEDSEALINSHQIFEIKQFQKMSVIEEKVSIFQKFIPSFSVWLCKPDVKGYLHGIGGEKITGADEWVSYIRWLGVKKVAPEVILNDSALLKRVFEELSGLDFGVDEIRKAVRYLIHGDRENFNDIQSPLWASASRLSPAWSKLRGAIRKGSWSTIKTSYWNELRNVKLDLIGLRPLSEVEIVKDLNQEARQTDRLQEICLDIEKLDWSEQERLELLRNEEIESNVWFNLPFHRRNGSIGPARVGQTIFYDSDIKYPEVLEKTRDWIRLSSDVELKKIQKRRFVEFNEEEVLNAYLDLEEPQNHCDQILELLNQLTSLNSSTAGKLRSVKWIPCIAGQAVNTSSLVTLPGLETELEFICGQDAAFGVITTPGLAQVNNANWVDLLERHKLTISEPDQIDKLCSVLTKIECYRVGLIREITMAELDTIVSCVKGISHRGWQLIHAYWLGEPQDDFRKANTRALLNSIRQGDPLDFIAEIGHNLSASGAKASDASAVLAIYLESFDRNQRTDKLSVLRDLRLPNAAGEWADAENLCIDAAGIDDKFCLDPRLIKPLGACASQASHVVDLKEESDTSALSIKQSVETLSKYFEPCLKVLPDSSLVGILATCLGSAYKEVAKAHLSGMSYEFVLDRLPPFTEASISENPTAVSWTEEQRKKILDQRFIVRLATGKSVQLCNILGDLKEFPINRSAGTLLAGGIINSRDHRELSLLGGFDFEGFNTDALLQVLKKTLKDLSRQINGICSRQIDELINQVFQGEHIDLEVTRDEVLRNLEGLFNQLDVYSKSDALASINRQIGAINKRGVEKRRAGNSEGERVAEKERDSKLKEMIRLVENDPVVQHVIQSAVESKIADAQYSSTSIPFELFQNADDAVLQAFELENAVGTAFSVSSKSNEFHIVFSEGRLSFMHWGRPINFVPHQANQILQDRFNADLAKMILVNASGKSKNEGVTGKFGLGFKSCYLVSTETSVASGPIRFSIKGGLVPVKWQKAQEVIKDIDSTSKEASARSTLVNLNLKTGLGQEILDDFLQCAPMLTIFAKKIDTIKFHTREKTMEFRWNPLEICEGVFLGKIHNPSVEKSMSQRVLFVDCPTGSVLFGIGSSGFARLGDCQSSAWVTVPTKENADYGFVFNSSFEVDPGRVSLAKSDQGNRQKALVLGKELLDRLGSMLASDKALESLGATLNGATVPDLRQRLLVTLLTTLTKPSEDTPAGVLAGLILKTLYIGLFKDLKQIPSGIDEKWVNLESGVETISLNQTHISSGFASMLTELKGARVQFISHAVASALKWAGHEFEVSPFSLLWFTKSLYKSQLAPKETKLVFNIFDLIKLNDTSLLFYSKSSFLQSLEAEFLSKDGSWNRYSSLINPISISPEFASFVHLVPQSAILNDGYVEVLGYDLADLNFKRFDSFEHVFPFAQAAADTAELAQWLTIMHAKGPLVLQEFLVSMRRVMRPAWLANPNEIEALLGLVSDPIAEMIKLYFVEAPDEESIPEDNDPFDQLPSSSWQALYDWWIDNQTQHIEAFDKSFWPECVEKNFSFEDINRKSWLTLFILASLQRLGRVRPEQNRNFITFLNQKGWLDTFAYDNPQEAPEKWIEVLVSYSNTKEVDEQWAMWMDSFPRILQFALRLEVYIRSFETLNFDEPSLAGILSPSTNTDWQGDDSLQAPSVVRTLRRGSSIVVRELLRAGVLDNPAAWQFAYNHSEAVRERVSSFESYGGESLNESYTAQEFMDALENSLSDMTFDGSYDIPFIAILGNPSLLNQISEYEE